MPQIHNKQGKKTKKFERAHLKTAIKKRRVAKHKKARLNKGKKEASGPSDEPVEEEEEDFNLGEAKLEDLDVDSFLREAFNSDGDDDDDQAQLIAGLEASDSDEGGGKSKPNKAAAKKGKKKAAAAAAAAAMSDEDSEQGSDDEAMRDEIEQHQAELEALAKTDPEFFKHLQKEDPNLLGFAAGESDSEDAAAERAAMAEMDGGGGSNKAGKDEEEGEKKAKKKMAKEGADIAQLTAASFRALRDTIREAPTLRTLQRMAKVFRAACHLNDDAKTGAAVSEAEQQQSVRISNSKVFNDLMRFALQEAPKAFFTTLGAPPHLQGTLGGADAGGGEGEEQHRSLKGLPRWKKLGPVVQSYLGNVLHFLRSLVDAQMIGFVLAAAGPMVPLYMCFPKLALRFLKELLKVWAKSETRRASIDAFLRIRELCLASPDVLMQQALKGVYLSYVRTAKFTSQQSLPGIMFRGNCVVELYGLDGTSAYQHGFVYIRQLAVHLRNALVSKTKESFKSVYNWQFVNCLRAWALVLSTHAKDKESDLYDLVYPFTQVCLGVISLLPVTRFFPLRFAVCKLLNRVCASCHIYVPVAPLLVEVLQAPELNRKPAPSSGKPPSLRYLLKVPKTQVSTRNFQEAMVVEALDLMLKHYNTYSYSIAFPELVLPVKLALKKYKNSTHIHRVRKQVTLFLDRLERNVQFIMVLRRDVPFSPADVVTKAMDACATFHEQCKLKNKKSPLNTYVASLAKDADELDEDNIVLGGEELDTAEEEAKVGREGKERSKQGKKRQRDKDDDGDAEREEADSEDDEDDGDDHEGDEEEEEEGESSAGDEEIGEDEVQDLVISSSEEEEEEEQVEGGDYSSGDELSD